MGHFELDSIFHKLNEYMLILSHIFYYTNCIESYIIKKGLYNFLRFNSVSIGEISI